LFLQLIRQAGTPRRTARQLSRGAHQGGRSASCRADRWAPRSGRRAPFSVVVYGRRLAAAGRAAGWCARPQQTPRRRAAPAVSQRPARAVRSWRTPPCCGSARVARGVPRACPPPTHLATSGERAPANMGRHLFLSAVLLDGAASFPKRASTFVVRIFKIGRGFRV
jgi:hypothetical protein